MSIAAQDLQATRTRLTGIVGKAGVTSAQKAGIPSHDGASPIVVTPADEAQAAEVAALANAEKLAVVVWGGGTKQDIQPVQPPNGIVIRTSKLNTTIELDAANLTVTVGAGKVMDELQRELATMKMFLPLDPIDSARATIGGTLAANSSGPNRLLYRTARDLVLGVRVVTPLGTTIRAGGKTVKDVAGYDMKKLYIGSWGTLGLITAATFRLLPLPETRATVAMTFSQLSGACGAVSALLGSFMRPSAADLLSAGSMAASVDEALKVGAGDYLLLVCVEGAVEDTERQKRDLAELAAKHGARSVTTLEDGVEREVWLHRKDVFAEWPQDRPTALVKGSVLLNRVFDFARGVASLRDEGLGASVAAHAGNGIVYAMVTAEPGGEEKLGTAIARLQQLGQECGGFALLQRAPAAVAEKLQLWPPRSDYGLMKGIKAQLDPNNLWNPARTPGGMI